MSKVAIVMGSTSDLPVMQEAIDLLPKLGAALRRWHGRPSLDEARNEVLRALHTMPFGEIQVMTNYSRDWVIMKLPLRVTYDTDVEKVRKLIKNLGVQLLDDPVIGENFIQPLKSQGVIEMQDSAMIIRVKFMTKPGDQWLVRKKVYEEIKDLFAREGIKFAHREVTVRLADGKVDALTKQEKEAVAGAVQAGIDDEERGGD